MKKLLLLFVIPILFSCTNPRKDFPEVESRFEKIETGRLFVPEGQIPDYEIYMDRETGVKYIAVTRLPHGFSFSRYYEEK